MGDARWEGANGWRERVEAKGDSGCEGRELVKAEFEREAGRFGDRGREREFAGRGAEPMSGTQLQATGKPCRYP